MGKVFTWILKTTLTWGCLFGGLFAIYQFVALPYFNQLTIRDTVPKVKAYRIPYPPSSKWYTAKAFFEKTEAPIIRSSQKGKIKAILVKPGDLIETGDPLLHLETVVYKTRLQELQGMLQDENLTAEPNILPTHDKPDEIKTHSTPVPLGKPETTSIQKLPPVNLTKLAQPKSAYSSNKVITLQNTSDNRVQINDEELENNKTDEPINPLKQEIGFLRWLIDDATLQTPVTGKVKSILVEPGQLLDKDSPIIELESQSNPTFRLSLDAQIGSQLHIGQNVYATFTDHNGYKHQLIATIQYFDPSSTTTTASIVIAAQPSDADAVLNLNENDTIDVSFQILYPDDIKIPCTTLYPKNGTYWVIQLIKKEKLYQLLPTPIVIQPLSATECQVISGLMPGGLIIYPEINHPLPPSNTLVNVTYDNTFQ